MGRSKRRNANRTNGQGNSEVPNNTENSALNRFFGGGRNGGYAAIPNVGFIVKKTISTKKN